MWYRRFGGRWKSNAMVGGEKKKKKRKSSMIYRRFSIPNERDLSNI